MRRFILPLAALALAGCSRTEPAPSETASPVRSPSAAPSPPAPARALLVPDRFQGVWDHEKGSCDPASEMRTEIAERGITFYESHGAVTALTVDPPERMTVELAMQGEGEKWTMTRTFTLSDGGAVLIASGGGDTGEPIRLKRCA